MANQRFIPTALLGRWRRSRLWDGVFGDYFTAALICGVAIWMATLPATRLLDTLFFDNATRAEPGRTPRVVLIEQDAAFVNGSKGARDLLPVAAAALGIQRVCFRTDPELPKTVEALPLPIVVGRPVGRIPGGDRWHFAAASNPLPDGVVAAANRRVPPENGIYRTQSLGLAGAPSPLRSFEAACAGRAASVGHFLVRTPTAQNIPRVSASQLVTGVFKGREMEGVIAIVAPPPSAHEVRLATPLNPNSYGMSVTLFSAYGVQTLADGREVRHASPWIAALAILLACFAATALLRPQVGGRRAAAPLLIVGALTVFVAVWLILQFGNLLLPLSAMAGGFLASGAAQMLRQARAQNRRLARTLEQAINLSFGRSIFYDQARIPDYLLTLARLLKLPRMAIFERGEGEPWRAVAVHGVGTEDLPLVDGATARLLDEARKSAVPIPAGAPMPGWSENAQIAILSEGDSDLAWVYDLPPGRLAPHSARVAQAQAQSLRQMRQWQYRLLGGSKGTVGQASIDARVSSAAKLITVQSEQIREGLDALDTAVLIFHPAGFAIQANTRMAKLCDQTGIVLEKTTIGEAICVLTGISPGQSDSIVQKMLLRGGEMRVPMQDVASRQYVLRIGASPVRDEDWQRVMVLEVVDVSELDQLAELRLSVGTFIDRQLRNDLEAITLGTTLALDPRLKPEALERVVGRIKDVAVRATGRLEQVSELLSEKPTGSPSLCYPIDAGKSVSQALERAQEFAADLSVTIDAQLPAISGFTVAEPMMLTDMVEAILRLVVADTAQGGTVTLELKEGEEHTHIRIAGGFGMPFDRLCQALDARSGEVPAEFQIAAAGFVEAMAWKGTVSYWSAPGDGYRFNIQLRRIG